MEVVSLLEFYQEQLIISHCFNLVNPQQMKESQIKSQLLFTSPNPLPWEGLELVTNKPTKNEPITIKLLSIPTQGSPNIKKLQNQVGSLLY